MTVVLAFAIGIVAGLRSMTAPAAVAWAAHFGWLHLEATPLALPGLCGGEVRAARPDARGAGGGQAALYAEQDSAGTLHRPILTGGLAGAGLAAGLGHSLVAGAAAGGLGAVAGTLGGYRARIGGVRALRVPDYIVALVEDAVAIVGTLLIVATRS